MNLRSPCWLSIALALTVALLQYGPVKGDADIESVRIHHDYQDMSGRGGDPAAKYWRTYDSLVIGRPLLNTDAVSRRISVSATVLRPPGKQALNSY